MHISVLFSLPQLVTSSEISQWRARKKSLWSLSCFSAIRKTRKIWSWANQLRMFKINDSTCLVWKLSVLIYQFRLDVLGTGVLVNAQQSATGVLFFRTENLIKSTSVTVTRQKPKHKTASEHLWLVFLWSYSSKKLYLESECSGMYKWHLRNHSESESPSFTGFV